jgi:fucose permease
MNWLHASWGLGLTIAPAIMTTIIVTHAMSWRVGYAMMIAVTLLLLVGILTYLRHWDGDTSDASGVVGMSRQRPHARMTDTIRQPVVVWSMLLFFVYGGVEIGTGQLANTILVESRHLDQETASLWISLYWGSFTVGRILTGFMAFRVDDRLILRVSVFLTLVGAILLVFRDIKILSLFGLVGIGFGLAAVFPILISQTPGRVGLLHSANTIGFQVGVTGFGAAILPGLFAWLTRYFGLEILSVGILLNSLLLALVYGWLASRYALKVSLAT